MKTSASGAPTALATRLVILPIGSVAPAAGGQVRAHFDASALQALAASVARSGMRIPILVAPDATEPGHYRIVAGERRWRAAHMAGLTEVPCLVDERLGDRKLGLLAQAEENLHREDLNVVEEASVLVQLMDAFSLGADEAGKLIGRSYQQARRLIQIHEAPQPIRDAIVQGHIDARAALELVRIYNKLAHNPGPDGKRRALAQLDELIDQVVNERWTIRRLERYARSVIEGGEPKAKPVDAAPAQKEPAVRSTPALTSTSRSSAPARAPAQSSAAYRREPNGIFIDTGRIERRLVTPEEREELIGILEHLLMAVRRA